MENDNYQFESDESFSQYFKKKLRIRSFSMDYSNLKNSELLKAPRLK
jgi:hypothetical protein